MARWQRPARLIIAVFAVLFAGVLAWQVKPRRAPSAPAFLPRTDPGAVIESTGGSVGRFKFSREEVSVNYQKQLTYADGSSKLFGVKVVTQERGGNRTFTVTGREGQVGKDDQTVTLDGDVHVVASDGLTVQAEHATYDARDGMVRASGPVTFSRGRLSGSGVGMAYDNTRDALMILQQPVIHIAPDANGGDGADVTSATAEFARRDKYARFDSAVRIQRGTQTIESDTATARMSPDEKHVERLELRSRARISTAHPAAGTLEALAGDAIDLTYGADGEVLQSAAIVGTAVIQVAGEAGTEGRQITANAIDVSLAPDGATPTSLQARDAVQLTMPADAGAGIRTIQANRLDADGDAKRGLTHAQFTGNVHYRERGGSIERAATSAALDVTLKPGMSAIEDARFARGVRFEEGKLRAVAANARYDLDRGRLQLSGSEPGAPVPRLVNEQIAVDAAKIDVTLEGPKVAAAGTAADKVKSVLQPAKTSGQSSTKMPSMLKQDQPVNVTAVSLDYDGAASKASYTGSAQLWQADTSIKADTIVIDDRTGDLTASGSVSTTTLLDQTNKQTNKKERARSMATAKDLAYEDATRKLTYTGDAHVSGPDGDMAAVKIELYLKPSGDELDRAEAYDSVTLREQKRTTTGSRMTYTTADERYVIVGAPVKIVDECERETTGRTLTFLKATDSIVVDGNQQARTQTKGGGKCQG